VPQQKSLKKNYIMNVLLTLSGVIFPLITFPYVSRVLTPVGTGKVSAATHLINYFLMFSQLGIPTYGVRAVAKVRDNKEKLSRLVQELLIISGVMMILSYIFLAICLAFVPKLQEDRTLYVIVSLTILFTWIGMEWLYRGLEQYTYITVRSVAFKFVALVAMFLMIHQKSDYVIYGGITILASSASYLLNFINARKYITLKPVGHYDFRPHLKAVMIFFAMSVATTVYTNLDVVMLKFMTTDVEVGYYDASIKIKTVLVSVVTALGAVLLPRASYYVEHGEMEEFRKITRKALGFVLLFSVPLATYFVYFAKPSILLVSGNLYLGSVPSMQIIMPTLVLIGITNILGIQVLVPTGRETQVLWSVITGAVVDLILNFLLIPKLGSAGAAIGTLAAELSVLVFQYLVLRKEQSETFRSMHYLRILVATLLSCAASFWVTLLRLPERFPQNQLGNFLTLLISALLFFGVYFGYMLLRKEPLAVEAVDILRKKLLHRGENS